jgi:hypothetical protein
MSQLAINHARQTTSHPRASVAIFPYDNAYVHFAGTDDLSNMPTYTAQLPVMTVILHNF